jgi:hypothetical protein
VKNNVVAFPTPLVTIDAQLRSAIAHKRLVEFTYKAERRIAEPHDYGRRNGIDKLLVYQRKKSGRYITGWRSLEVSKIEDLASSTTPSPAPAASRSRTTSSGTFCTPGWTEGVARKLGSSVVRWLGRS